MPRATGLFAGLLIGCLTLVASGQPALPAAPQEVVLGKGGALRATVTANGLARVRLSDGFAVETGAWVFQTFNHWFSADDTDGSFQVERETQPRRLMTSQDSATVTQTYDGATCTATYTVQGEDVLVACTLTNTAPKPMRFWGFSGMSLPRSEQVREPVCLPGWNADYTRFANGGAQAVMSPSHWIRLRAAQVVLLDSSRNPFGVALSTKGIGLANILWTAPDNAPRLIVRRDIQPTETMRFTLRLRFSRRVDPHALFAGYYADHVAEFGPLQFYVDQRPWVVFNRFGAEAVTRNNPYGYHSFPDWRLDTRRGAGRMGADLAPLLAEAGCQGLMAWGLGHYQQPGEWGYTVNFHAIPKPIRDAVPDLTTELNRRGLKLGLLARPGNVTVAGNGEVVSYLPVQDNSAMRAEMLRRFAVLQSLKVEGSYLDDYLFLEPVKVLWWLRPRLGRDYAWYAEFSSDITAPIAGVYAELSGPANRLSVGDIGWQLEALRKMYPQLPVILRNRSELKTADYVAWCAVNKYSALVDDWELFNAREHYTGRNPLVEALRRAYDGNLKQTTASREWPD